MTEIKSGDLEIAQRLKKLRLEYGVTMKRVAEIVGVSRPTMYEIEKGIRSITLRETFMLMSYYGIGLEALMLQDYCEGSESQSKLEIILATELGRLTPTSLARVISKAHELREESIDGSSKVRPIGVAKTIESISQMKVHKYKNSAKT